MRMAIFALSENTWVTMGSVYKYVSKIIKFHYLPDGMVSDAAEFWFIVSVATYFSHLMSAISGNTVGPGDVVVNEYVWRHVAVSEQEQLAGVVSSSCLFKKDDCSEMLLQIALRMERLDIIQTHVALLPNKLFNQTAYRLYVEEASNAMALDGIIFESQISGSTSLQENPTANADSSLHEALSKLINGSTTLKNNQRAFGPMAHAKKWSKSLEQWVDAMSGLMQ
ncbi:hypothetical protein Tco_1295983 [Tanacetum coccineum]